MKILHQSDFERMDRRYRANLFNGISGFKNAVLIGTCRSDGMVNLAIFNSLVHLGADPPLLGFILRPHTVPRHTWEAILENGHFTVNLITEAIYRQAHQTSAKYPADRSEFDACGFEPRWEQGFPAPFVAESPVRMGLTYRESHLIEANQTRLIVGEVVQLHIPADLAGPEGHPDLEKEGIVCSLGLDTYFRPRLLERLPYARPSD
jgi:flavin reductase (DIM6/NTAB) family NADH-FMN oxidoreductase RutF